jgi:hypothetical protein
VVPERRLPGVALAAVVEAPLTVAGVAAMVESYEVVRPYWNDTAVVLPQAFTLPFKVADVSPIPLAATVATTGRGGATIKQMLCADPGATFEKRSPAANPLVLTHTGKLLFVVPLLPN